MTTSGVMRTVVLLSPLLAPEAVAERSKPETKP
jgi:hypothetical protein